MNHAREPAEADAGRQREGDLAHEIASMAGDDRGPYQPIRAPPHVDLDEAFFLAVDHGAVHLGERSHEGVDRDPLGDRVAFVESDVGHFRIRVGAPRHGQRGDALASEEQRVLDHDSRREIGRMGELRLEADVAGREDPRIGRSQVVVDDDAMFCVERDAHGVQTETFDIGRAAGSDQDLVDREPVFTAIDREVERLSLRPPFDRPNL
jgi:hypothetical protein